jgi:integrase
MWHEIMAAPPQARAAEVTPPDRLFAVELMDRYLDWTQKNRAGRTYDWYRDYLQTFADALPKGIRAADVRPLHVTAAMDSKRWGGNSKHNLARAVQRAFAWAERQGMIDRSPVRFVEKPAMEAREEYVTPEEYARILAEAIPANFRELIRFAWESGARPQEIVAIEGRHVDFDQHRIVFPRDEAKGKKAIRVIYLTPEALSILKPLAGRYPTGTLFRTAAGTAWDRRSVNSAFYRLGKKSGIKTHLGAFRKGYTTQALKNGVDTVSVAALLGHKDAVMVSRVYAKVSQDPEFMRKQAARATSRGDAST